MAGQSIEQVLKALSRRILRLERQRQNPFNDPTIQSELEGGSLVSARTRRMPLTVIEQNSAGGLLFADAASTVFRAGIAMPSDWVPETNIILKMVLTQIATAGSPTAVLRSWIAAWSDTEDVSAGIDNIESNVNINTTFTLNIMKVISRTVTGISLVANDIVTWAVQRTGADATDTVDASLHMRGAWMEYTAFF